MVRDMVPELLSAIRADFDKELGKSPELLDLLKVLADGLATHKQSNQYAILVGELLAKVLSQHVTADSLPDGRMYYNIADRVLNETLGRNHELVTDYAGAVQGLLNEQAGLGMVVKVPELDRDRVDGLVNKVATAEDFEQVKWVLQEPVVNFSQSVVDKTILENVDFHASAGLTPKIVRKGAGNCCEWCQALIGTFEYGKEPKDVYRRHERCRCTVEYVPDKNRRQNVHTREWTTKEKNSEVLEVRKKIGLVDPYADKLYQSVKREWLKHDGKGKVVDMDYWEHEGVKLPLERKAVELSYSQREYDIAVWLSSELGKTFQMAPRVSKPDGVKTPDYLVDGKKFDLKDVDGNSSDVLISAIKGKRKQATNFIFDIHDTKLSVDELLQRIDVMMSNKRYDWLETVMLTHYEKRQIIDIFGRK